MGVVYRAHHALLRRETAVKLLLPDRADDEVIRQFEHEVQLTCRLTHPNTIQIYDYGHTEDGIFYYAMELLRGMTLQDLIARHGAQPEERVIHLLGQVCESLQEAHAVGLIHRDIKPGNLFLCERGRVPDTVKVLDFGLVRRFAPEAKDREAASAFARAHRFVGTPLYMAPESINDPGVGDPRSDLYALGAVGYVLLSGQPVFADTSVEAVWEQHRTATPLPFSELSMPPVSAELEGVIRRCLEKDPDRRYASAGELLAALRQCPRAADWTLERRRRWWAGHVDAGVLTVNRPLAPVDVTVKIDLSDRAASP
jgi:serine/threonine protein kinase